MGSIKTIAWMTAAFAVAAFGVPQTASAQNATADVSPVLLIETGPSDNPSYRRMVFVKYLSADSVRVSYKAYNRSEFIQIEDGTPPSLIASCLTGRATTLADVRAYNAAEAKARAAQQRPEITHFCIKGVQNWDAGNRSVYLDPIFDGMPHAANLNN